MTTRIILETEFVASQIAQKESASERSPPPPAPSCPQQPQRDMELQDELLPAHKRRAGRIGSLHEFQQRALSYQEGGRGSGPDAPPPPRPLLSDIFDHSGEASGAAPAVADTSAPALAIDVRDLLRFSGRGSSAASPNDDTDSDYHLFDQFRKPIRQSQRSRSVGSLFGGARYHPKSSLEFYGRQLKVLSFLVLLGVISGPLGYGMRRYGQLRVLSLLIGCKTMFASYGSLSQPHVSTITSCVLICVICCILMNGLHADSGSSSYCCASTWSASRIRTSPSTSSGRRTRSSSRS